MAKGGSGKRGADADPLIGQVIANRYRVVRRIGRGGMGAIYEVQHLRLRRTFALKRLSQSYAEDPVALTRFQREADVVARLRHPNVVEIVDWETLSDGSPCMIMELLRGEDLGQRLRRAGPLPWHLIARLGDQMLSALQVAHRAGIVHRDLKPQNIFIAQDDAGDEHAKLLDFGVSKIRHSDSSLTGDYNMIGTPSYMAPEQAEGQSEAIGPASDVWAMGAILYAMATARHAFQAENPPSVLYRVCHGEPDPLPRYRPDAPPAFVRLIGRAMSRDPGLRLTDVAVFRQKLREALIEMATDVLALAAPVPPPLPEPGPGLGPTPELPDGLHDAPTTLSRANGEVSGSMPLLREPGRSHRVRTVVVAFVATVVLGGLGVARYLGRTQPGAAPGPSTAVSNSAAASMRERPAPPKRAPPPAAAPAPAVAPAPPAAPAPAAAPAPPAAPPAAAAPAPPAAPPAAAAPARAPAPPAEKPAAAPRARAEVVLDSSPHADVYGSDDRKLGRTPLSVPVPEVVRLERPGYKAARFALDGSRSRVELRLERLPGHESKEAKAVKEALPAAKNRSSGFLDP